MVEAHRAGWCVHYKSPREKDGDVCGAGVEMSSWDGTPFDVRPCYLVRGKPRPGAVFCEHLRPPTVEEMAAADAALRVEIERMAKVMEIVHPWRKLHKGQTFSELVVCPICSGRLRLSISGRNNHVHGRCQTIGCLNWME